MVNGNLQPSTSNPGCSLERPPLRRWTRLFLVSVSLASNRRGSHQLSDYVPSTQNIAAFWVLKKATFHPLPSPSHHFLQFDTVPSFIFSQQGWKLPTFFSLPPLICHSFFKLHFWQFTWGYLHKNPLGISMLAYLVWQMLRVLYTWAPRVCLLVTNTWMRARPDENLIIFKSKL